MVKLEKIWEEYYKKHAVCPKCFSDNWYTTCIGCHEPPDINRCRCDCGWSGSRDEMVENKKV